MKVLNSIKEFYATADGFYERSLITLMILGISILGLAALVMAGGLLFLVGATGIYFLQDPGLEAGVAFFGSLLGTVPLACMCAIRAI